MTNQECRDALKSWQDWWQTHGFRWYMRASRDQSTKPPVLRDGQPVFGFWLKDEETLDG